MSEASEVELLMLELINQERTSRGLDPLAINNDLNETAEDHSQWMLDNDIFNHTGVGGSSSGDRIAASDYELEGNWRTAENIGWQSERGDPGIADDVSNIHANLMASPGHRANILNPDLEDIGIGVELGDFNGYDAVMITQNFGRTDAVNAPLEDESTPVVMSENETPEMPEEPPVVEGPTVVKEPASEAEEVALVEETVVIPEDDGVTTDSEDTVIETADDGSLVDITDEDEGAPMAPAFDLAALFGRIVDGFDFADLPMMDNGANDVNMVTAFEGTIATPEGKITSSDPADFEALFAMSCMPGIENSDLG